MRTARIMGLTHLISQAGFAQSRLRESATLAAFCLLFGALAAALSGYQFGTIDHAEQLPAIYRLMDAGYLVNDFQTNSATSFGPRYYFAQTMAALGGVFPLEAVYAALYLLVYIAIALITAFAARDITGSAIAGIVAATLICSSLSVFHLSTPARVTDVLLLPRFLAMPFALYAVWQGIRGKPIQSALAAIPAILTQPLLGLEAAALGLAAAIAHRAALLNAWHITELPRRFRREGAAALAIFAASLFWLVPTLATGEQGELSSEEFVRIYGHIRHPHHIIPSAWDWQQYALGALFAVAVAVSLAELWRHRRDVNGGRSGQAPLIAIITVFAAIGVALACGYLFVEIFPTRLFAVAQTFRLTVVFAWLGWLIIAYSMARAIGGGVNRRSLLVMASAISAPTLALYKTIAYIRRLPRGDSGRDIRRMMLLSPLAALALAGAVSALHLFETPSGATLFLLAIGFATAAMASVSARRGYVALAGLACVLALALGALYLDRTGSLPPMPPVSDAIARRQPMFTIEEAAARFRAQDRVKLAHAAREHTPPDAVILIPWDWSEWRLFSERAVVVDWKFFLFTDEGMREWNDRYDAIYAFPGGAGYPTAIGDDGLAELRRRYGFDYAILPVGAGFRLPTLLNTSRWKLVDVTALDAESE